MKKVFICLVFVTFSMVFFYGCSSEQVFKVQVRKGMDYSIPKEEKIRSGMVFIGYNTINVGISDEFLSYAGNNPKFVKKIQNEVIEKYQKQGATSFSYSNTGRIRYTINEPNRHTLDLIYCISSTKSSLPSYEVMPLLLYACKNYNGKSSDMTIKRNIFGMYKVVNNDK